MNDKELINEIKQDFKMHEEKQKEIEEMARDYCNVCPSIKICRLKSKPCIAEINDAERYYNAGYRNVKDKIVLSKEEYVDLTLAKQSIFKMLDEREDKLRKEFDETCEKCHWITDYNILKIHENEVIKLCEQEVKQARKETAREIIDNIKFLIEERNGSDIEDLSVDGTILEEVLVELAKQYGVEVE